MGTQNKKPNQITKIKNRETTTKMHKYRDSPKNSKKNDQKLNISKPPSFKNNLQYYIILNF